MDEPYLRESRFYHKDGEIEFDFITVDGIGLPSFLPSYTSGGYSRRIKDIQLLDCRHDDIILATYHKCGTHWTYEILNMLLQGTADYVKHVKESFMLEALPDLSTANTSPSPRVLNTHLPYKWLPKKHIENHGKIIHTTRNPKDAYVSHFFHASSSLALGNNSKGMSWSQYYDTCVIKKNVLYGSWFDYEKEMAAAKESNKNIYTIHYEELKKNPIEEIRALASFLEIQASDNLVTDIAYKCSFENLKKANENVKIFPNEIFRKPIRQNENVDQAEYRQKPNIYRKGLVGDWKNHFTVAQNEQFDDLFEREMNNSDVRVIY